MSLKWFMRTVELKAHRNLGWELPQSVMLNFPDSCLRRRSATILAGLANPGGAALNSLAS